MTSSFVRFSINCISAFIEKEQEKINFSLLFETLLGFKLLRSMANLYRNQREWAEVKLGVIIPLFKNRIITPIILETVSHLPRFIGSLVSSSCYYNCWYYYIPLFILAQTFYNYKSISSFATEYSFIIVSLCSKLSLTHFV